MASHNKPNGVYNAEFNRAVIDSLRVTRLFFSGADIHYISLATPVTISQGGLYIVNESVTPASTASPLITVTTTQSVIIHGEGQTIDTSLLPASAHIIQASTGGTNVQLIGLAFVGRTTGTQVLVETAGSGSFLMTWCRVTKYVSGVQLSVASQDITVANNHFELVNRCVEQVDGGGCVDLTIVGNHARSPYTGLLGYLAYLRGACINCTTAQNKLTNMHVYCYNCTNCNIEYNKVFDNVAAPSDNIAFICGGDATPSAPTNPGADLGCTNCNIQGNQVTQINIPPGAFFAYGAVLCMYSKNCWIRDNQVRVEEPTKTTVAAAITTSYCDSCTHENNKISGVGMLAEFGCDVYDLNIPCRSTVFKGAVVSGFTSGLCAFRCTGVKVVDCHISDCEGGILCSEGVQNCEVRDCSVSNCTAFGLFNGVLVAGPGKPFTDPFAAPPVNTNLINNGFHGTVGGIVQPVPTVMTGFNVVN